MAKNVRLSLATGVVRVNASTDKRASQRGHPTRANVLVVAARAGTSACAEQVSSGKVNDDTSKCDAILLDSNGHRRTWQVIHEVCRAVDRVDDPSDSGLASDGRPLFAQDSVVGALLKNALYERPLGPFVCAGDWTCMTILESDCRASITGPVANATCNVGSKRYRKVEEFLSTCHSCHVSAHVTR